jgi:hypothetical protein
MLKGTRILMNEEAREYTEVLNKIRDCLHQI